MPVYQCHQSVSNSRKVFFFSFPVSNNLDKNHLLILEQDKIIKEIDQDTALFMKP